MPTIEENATQNINTSDKNKISELSEIQLIHTTTGIHHDVPANYVLAIRDKIANKHAKIDVKHSGHRFTFPLLQDAKLVDLTKYTVVVKDPENQDGRYRQDIGIGDDISLTMKITFKVDGKEIKYINRLVKQENAYKDAIRSTSETIMRLMIQSHYQENPKENDTKEENKEQKTDITKYRKMESQVLDLESLVTAAMNNKIPYSDTISNEIAKEAIELHENYGITITKIDFTDIDLSERLKKVMVDNIEAENKRKRDEAQAKLDKKIAQNQAEAEKIKIETEIKALKEQGFTNEQIAYYYTMKNMPENAIIAMGQGVSPMQDYMATNMAMQKKAPLKRVKNADTTNNEPEEIDANELEKGHSK